MFIRSIKYRFIGILFVLTWIVPWINSPALAEDKVEPPSPTISFVQEGELVIGPPIPSFLDFVIDIKDIGNQYANLDIHVLYFADEKGQELPPTSLQTPSCEYKEEKVQTNIQDQTITRRICLNPDNLKWGTYTVLLQANLGDLAQTTKSIKLVAGPESPIAILNSEITVLGTACPKFARSDAIKELLCPDFGDYNVYITEGTDLITVTGYSKKDTAQFKKFFDSASGTLVSADGAGTVFARLERLNNNSEENFIACPPNRDQMICSGARLRFWGIFKAGTYSGVFYLNTGDQSNDAMKVPVTFKVKDHWLLPTLIITLGLIVSAWVTWQLGSRKADKQQENTKVVILRKRNELENSLNKFNGEITEMEQSLAYFVEDPDIIIEAKFLLNSSKDISDDNHPADLLTHIEYQDLAQRMILIVPLFVRLRFFYPALYKLYVWAHRLPDSISGKGDLKIEIEGARSKLWTADSEAKMDEAEDALIHAFISAHTLYWASGDEQIPEPPKFKVETQPVTRAGTESRSLEQQAQEWLTNFGKVLPGFLVSLVNIPNLFRWAIVLLSGIYVVYVTNPTFGTPQDYIYAFLWGSATNAGIEFVTKFFGANSPILSAISGVAK